ncbi:MAG TPA: aminotransferase class III-fold pyridoxal phosphate-dependent enzyme [Stellaceae bacterium]|nr:aminotransferase class III-fold pyridoxal phosphate-dependent enzyme [Stellaceae bacterium]
MPEASPTNSRIVAAYRERTPQSERLAAEAREMLPSGITHDARYLKPYGIYIDHAKGARKWDVDGNEYVDYFGGHGSLILGHNHPGVVAATHAALEQGTHFGANHAREVRWAELVRKLVPSAERVRFTSSGTEATLMAVRLARAFTGKPKFIRFLTNFHGWHDHMTAGHASHFDGTPTTGVLAGIAENVVLLPQGDAAALKQTLGSRDDIGCVILEPTGASFGAAPLAPGFLSILREETAKRGILLIFDEVITGFRVSPGGAQAEFGVTPDLTALAKILAGGLPGGAVCGRRDVLDELDFEAAERKKREKIAHPGTYNANPLSAAAGIAALDLVGSSDACKRANAIAAALRERLNEVLTQERVPWAVHGTFSGFHIFLNPQRRPIDPLRFDPFALDYREMLSNPPALARLTRLALLSNGVDVNGRLSGFTSAAHGPEDIDRTAAALKASIRMLRSEGELQ